MPTSTQRRRLLTISVAASIALLTIAPSQATATLRCDPPVEPFRVAALASLPHQDWLPGHRGIDLAAAVGHTVTAPAAGEVTYVGFVVDRPVVSIRHSGGFVSSFEPVDASVGVGEVVDAGETVGTVASVRGHCAPATCVHWGLRRDGRYVDPLDYVRGFGPVRLLPLEPWP
jgi:murein DD-endopeptidase MepM/ murein hydrolase activator NlpD